MTPARGLSGSEADERGGNAQTATEAATEAQRAADGSVEYGMERIYQEDGEPYGFMQVFETRTQAEFAAYGFNPGSYHIVVRDVGAWRGL